jgi:cytochrome P450
MGRFVTSSPEASGPYAGFEIDKTYDRFHEQGQAVGWLNYDGGMWLVSAHEEVSRVLREDEIFSSAHDLPNGATPFTGAIAPPPSVRVIPLEVDPPDYRNYRRLLAPLFAPSAMSARAPAIAQYATWCIDQRIESGAMDLYADYLTLVPALVVLHLLGLAPEDARILADAVHAQADDRFDTHPGWSYLEGQISAAIAARSARPGDDLISRALTAEVDGWKVPPADIPGICFAMIVGGMPTTTKLALGAFSYFGVHLDERSRAADPEYLRTAIEEFLRYYSPIPFLCRTATQDVMVGGQEIRRGDRIAVSFAAANRDPAAFRDPSVIDPARSANRHVAFGLGLHFCVGAALARTVLTAMIGEVLRRMPDYRLAGGDAPRPGGAARRGRHLSWRGRLDRGLQVTFAPGARIGDGRELSFNRLG